MIGVGGTRLFACDECPIVEQLDMRLAIAEEYPQYGDFQFYHCSCDKVDGEFFASGYCEDAWCDMPKRHNAGQRRTGRLYRRKMRKQHLKKYRDRKGYSRICHAPYPNCEYIDDEYVVIGSYICYPHNSKRQVYLKRVSNKAIRKNKFDLPAKGNWHHKLFDYQWELY